MTIYTLGNFLLWCTVLNYVILILWFLVFCLAHEWMFKLHGRWFRLTATQFDAIHYGGMSVYKIGILLLNLVPLIALHFVPRHVS
jgi:hypothetical protein